MSFFSFQITAIAVIPIFKDLSEIDPEKNVWPWGLIMVPSLIVGGFLFFFCLSKVGERLMRKIELEAACPHHPKIDQIEKGSDQNSIETLDIIPEKVEFENDLPEQTEVVKEIPEKIEAEKMDIENSVQPMDDSPSR